MIYKCTKTSGSGREDDAGDWIIKETPKTYTFARTREPFYSWGFSKGILKIKKDLKNSHGFNDWGDGTYTIYPLRGGIPFYFEPMEIGNINEGKSIHQMKQNYK